MLKRFMDARLLWPTVAALVAFAILVGLGTWQLQRKAWKEGILAKIAERVSAPPMPLAALAGPLKAGADLEYTHVVADGRFLHDRERYLYAPGQGGLQWQVLTPLEMAGGEIVWINRGLVPDAQKAPAERRAGLPEGNVRVTGLLRQPQAAAFTPVNDVARNIWYWADPAGLTQSAFARSADTIVAWPLIIEADATATPPGGMPQGGVTRLAISNRHLEYVVTWYGLALTLIGVFAAFVRMRLRAL